MGILDDFEIDLDEYEADEGGFPTPDAGFYEWQIAKLRRQDGSTNDPNFHAIFIDFLITNEELGVAGMSWSELFMLPKHNPPTANERIPLKRYKARLTALGVPDDQMNGLESEDIEGMTGTFELEHSKAKGANTRTYVNVRNFAVDDGEDEPEPEAEPEVEKAAPVKKAATVKAPAAKAAPAAKTSRFTRG